MAYWAFDLRFRPLSRDWGIVSMDYIPLHPWFGVVLIGLFLTSCGLHLSWQKRLNLPPWVSFISRHSLKIYMAHQVVLYGLIFSLHKLLA